MSSWDINRSKIFPTRLGMNLVPGSVFFGWFRRFEVWFCRTNLGLGGSRFRIFRFVPIPNGKFTHFLIFYEVRTFGSVRGSVFFGMFGGRSSVSKDTFKDHVDKMMLL